MVSRPVTFLIGRCMVSGGLACLVAIAWKGMGGIGCGVW